jgi:hypothetical protein
MKKNFRTNDRVRLSGATAIPVRYRGRLGTVVGRERVGNGFRFLVDLGTRRSTPLPVAGRFLTLV